jgi:hypothetical protein
MDAVRETTTLIAADKVQGTDVFNNGGDRLGSIHDLMIDKQTGQVAYAIMSFGGFLGMGNSYHPLPWSLLRYNTNLCEICRRDRSESAGRRALLSGRDGTGVGRSPITSASSTTITASSRLGPPPARCDARPSSEPLGLERA